MVFGILLDAFALAAIVSFLARQSMLAQWQQFVWVIPGA